MRVLSFVTAFFFVAIGLVAAAPSAKVKARGVADILSLIHEVIPTLNRLEGTVDVNVAASAITDATGELTSITTELTSLTEGEVNGALIGAIDELANSLLTVVQSVNALAGNGEIEAVVSAAAAFSNSALAVLGATSALGIADSVISHALDTVTNTLDLSIL